MHCGRRETATLPLKCLSNAERKRRISPPFALGQMAILRASVEYALNCPVMPSKCPPSGLAYEVGRKNPTFELNREAGFEIESWNFNMIVKATTFP